MARKIEVVSYNTNWPKLYETEAGYIRQMMNNHIYAIHHIGSTSIPRIKAKPILDIMIETHDIQAIDSRNQDMKKIGYEARGEYGIPGRRYFVKRQGDIHTHHIHVYQVNHPEIQRHIFFRDYLRAHPKTARQYGQLKERLAGLYTYDSQAYTEAKSEFIKEIDALAAAWKKSGE